MAKRLARAETYSSNPVDSVIVTLRGQQVVIDADLARVYGVSTKALNQAVKRNSNRFPAEFAFHLTEQEKTEVVTNCDHLKSLKFSRQLPRAFTEHGVLMAANVLNSETAIHMSVLLVRAFVRLRQILSSNRQIAARLDELESKVDRHDRSISTLIEAIRQLMADPDPGPRPKIGYHTEVKSSRHARLLK